MSSSIPPNEQPRRQDNSLAKTAIERPGALRFLFERAALSWRLLWDGRVGVLPKLLPVAAIVYLVSPVDLVPALMLGPLAPLGALDDVGIMILALNLFIQVSPPDVVKEHLRELSSKFSRSDDNVIEGTVEDEDEPR